jgi:tRNA modification GTPase
MTGVSFILATANHPGAIAIFQLHGPALELLQDLTGIADWPLHRARLANFADIDEGIAVRITEEAAQLMPHGGPRVVQRLAGKLADLGAQRIDPIAVDPEITYPEASDRIEALMLATLAAAESPLAIDLLLDQPRRWRDLESNHRSPSPADLERSRRLNRLIRPPRVVLVGRPNVGKSTLSNALLGREMSITLDEPGTTRDFVAARIDLAGLVVDWFDTPGIRRSDDPLERHAIELAKQLIDSADCVVAMNDPATPWPELSREPDLRITNKSDLSFPSAAAIPSLSISAITGSGIPALVAAIRDHIVPPADRAHSGPWLFDPRLAKPSHLTIP